MMNVSLDHIVVAALDLEQGADYVERQLGVRVLDGGQHRTLGTHNKVMSLGQGCYLEIIAVDPDLPAPPMPRWFGLDDPAIIASLRESPRLITWAVNTTDLDTLLAASTLNIGVPTALERGDLRWKVALSDDGRLSAGGFLPLCIQWQTDCHPSTKMADLGCRLKKLVVSHPYPNWMEQVLASIGAGELVSLEQSGRTGALRATIETPFGIRTLDSVIV